jgi:hypothetical protein
MTRLTLAWMVVTAFALLTGRTARGADSSFRPPAPLRLALAADAAETPAPSETKAPAGEGAGAEEAGALPVVETLAEQEVTRPPDLSYGVATRLRWVSVPRWLLNAFTKQNVPLSSWATALEVFRRKGDFEFAFSIGYQNMTPPDGNWLGKGTNNAAAGTDYVQVRGLGFLGMDLSFIYHAMLTNWFGLHFGAGLGLATIFGSVNRTSNDPSICTEANAGNVNACHPRGVDPTSTTMTVDRQIQLLGTGPDNPNDPHRFSDPNVPGFLPIVNIALGIDFRLPGVRGWEAKLEGGFYDAFFLGGGVGYTF